MNGYLKYFFPLLILFLVISCGSVVTNSIFRLGMSDVSTVSLAFSFAVSTFLLMFTFKRGLSREHVIQAMHTFAAVGIKFLAELFIALVWFVGAKKTSAEYILLFFVLYLAFSLFSIIVIVKTLKKKSL